MSTANDGNVLPHSLSCGFIRQYFAKAFGIKYRIDLLGDDQHLQPRNLSVLSRALVLLCCQHRIEFMSITLNLNFCLFCGNNSGITHSYYFNNSDYLMNITKSKKWNIIIFILLLCQY